MGLGVCPSSNFRGDMWLDGFPIPTDALPTRFVDLVAPVGLAASDFVDIATHLEIDPHGQGAENLLMQTALVPESDLAKLGEIRARSDFSVVSQSTPDIGQRGECAQFQPSIGGYDYVVASWGSSSFFNFYLAEKVWMALGLSARTIGGDHQRIIFDDIRLPEFGVAEGEASNEYEWTSKRPVRWRLRNDYLRRYLWMRGMHGVRVFYYSCRLLARTDLLSLLDSHGYFEQTPEDGRYLLDLRRDADGLLMQVWGVAPVLAPELCPMLSANELVWPVLGGPMTEKRVRELRDQEVVIRDSFLEKYEQDAVYGCSVFAGGLGWSTSPRYRGQWAFTDCVRVGRDCIRVPLRKLYEGLPDREIIHAHTYAMGEAETAAIDATAKNVVDRTDRVVRELMNFGQALANLLNRTGIETSVEALVHLSPDRIRASQWEMYPEVRRLARVARLDMSQADFLSRCKSLNELLNRTPQGPLKRFLVQCGYPSAEVKELRAFRLWQAILNLVEEVNARGDTWEALEGLAKDVDCLARNPALSPIFHLNELRNGESHDSFSEVRFALEAMGFDTALLNGGYGIALDHVYDAIGETLERLADKIWLVLGDER